MACPIRKKAAVGGRRSAVAFLLLLALASPARAQDPSMAMPVVPQPQQVEQSQGRFPMAPEATVLELAAADTVGLMLPVTELQETYRLVAGAAPALSGAQGRLTIRIGLPAEDAAFRSRVEKLGIWPDERIGEEGYVLLVRPEEVVVAARTRTGLYYGAQTLKQLLRGYRDEAALPGLKIVDWPDLRWRGLMDDISRGPVPTLDYMKQQVRRLAEMKSNLLTYYTENVTATKRHGDFAPEAGAVTLEEWAELADYARQYHVTLVGNFQSFGHFEKILDYPQYASLGESGDMLSPVLPGSIALLRDVYEEMVPAFDAPFFHVNSDETFDLGRGYSKARADSLGKGVVYAEHVNRMHAVLDSLGVRMMMWGDIVLEHPEVLAMIPKDVVMCTWTYDPRESFDDMIEPFQQAGFDVMVSPGVLNSNRLMPDFHQASGNIRGFVADAVEHHVLGMLNTVWDDGGVALFAQDWYGVALAADQSWHSDPEDATYDVRFSRGLYASAAPVLPQAIEALHALAPLEPTDGLTDKVLYQQLVPLRGHSLRISLNDVDRVVDVADSAAALLDTASPLLHEGDVDAFRFTAALYRLLADSRLGLVEAAQAYRSASFLQRDDRPAARRDVVRALDRLGTLRQQWIERAVNYRRLWLAENRTHALNHTLEHYDANIQALADAEDRVMQALRDFDMGQYLPPPSEVRLAIEESTGRYFREWLMSGPLPNPAGAQGTGTDYLTAMGGEQTAHPGVAQEWTYKGNTYRWHRKGTALHAVTDLAALYPMQHEDAVLYAYATISSDEDRRVRAAVGSTDGMVVFLNGEKLYEKKGERTLVVDEDEVWLPLKAGRNHLLLKTAQGKGDWSFTFRILDAGVHSRKNRYEIVE